VYLPTPGTHPWAWCTKRRLSPPTLRVSLRGAAERCRRPAETSSQAGLGVITSATQIHRDVAGPESSNLSLIACLVMSAVFSQLAKLIVLGSNATHREEVSMIKNVLVSVNEVSSAMSSGVVASLLFLERRRSR
jgi:hypothetical protein